MLDYESPEYPNMQSMEEPLQLRQIICQFKLYRDLEILTHLLLDNE